MADPTSKELLQDLQAQGYTLEQIATALGRSPRLLRFVARGQKPGTNLTGALSELASSGKVTHQPSRRIGSDGRPAPVRAPGGRTVVPPTPRGQRPPVPPAKPIPGVAPIKIQRRKDQTGSRSIDQPGTIRRPAPEGGRNRLGHQINRNPSGRELHRITVPRRTSAATRKEGSTIMASVIEGAAAAGRRISGTVWVEVDTKDGGRERVPVPIGGHGGYDPNAMLRDIANSKQGAFGWIGTQIANRYPEWDDTGWTVVGTDLDVW